MDSDPAATTTDLRGDSDVRRLAKAARFAIVCMLLIAAAQNIATAVRIGRFGRIIEDMLGSGPQLPVITMWVLEFELVIRLVAYALPIAALGLLFMRDITRSIYAAGILLLFTMAMNAIVNHAIWEPMLAIIRRMQGGA